MNTVLNILHKCDKIVKIITIMVQLLADLNISKIEFAKFYIYHRSCCGESKGQQRGRGKGSFHKGQFVNLLVLFT